MINKTLYYLVTSGLWAILLVPLIVSPSLFFPFITGKNFTFRLIIEIVFALWLILAIRVPVFRPKKSWLLWAVLAVIGVLSLATIFGENPYRSFWSNFERMEGLITHLHLAGYFLVLISVFKSRKDWRRFFNISLMVSLGTALYGVTQLLGWQEIHQGGVRVDATLGNAAYMAVYMLFHIFLAVYLWLSGQFTEKWQIWGARIYYGLAIVLELIILYYTATRGTIIGLVVGLFFALLAFAITEKGKVRSIAGGLLLAVLVLLGGFWAIRGTDFVQKSPVLVRFASISLTETTTLSRFLIWNMSWEGFKESPILGWGPENYQLVFNKYYDPKMYAQEPWFDRSHNVIFDWLINAGILGLLAYLSLYAVAKIFLWQVYSKNRQRRREIIVILALLLAYFIHNIFVFDNLISYLLFFSILAYINFLWQTRESEEAISLKDKEGNAIQLSVIGVIVLVLLGAIYYLEYKPWQASRLLIMSISSAKPETALANFKQLYSLNTFANREATEQLMSYSLRVFGRDDISNDLKQEFGLLAIARMNEEMKRAGNDARPYLLFSNFYGAIGQYDKALELLNKGLAFSPKKQLILFQLISVKFNQGDFAGALALAKQAYELEPNYPEAVKMYVAGLNYTGQAVAADALLEKSGSAGNSAIDDDLIIKSFSKAGRDDLAKKWLAKRAEILIVNLAKNPSPLAADYIKILEVYSQLGATEKRKVILDQAIKYYQTEIKDNPFDPGPAYQLAELYQHENRQVDVNEVIITLLKRLSDKILANPKDFTYYRIASEVLIKGGQSVEAEKLLAKALVANPANRYNVIRFASENKLTIPR